MQPFDTTVAFCVSWTSWIIFTFCLKSIRPLSDHFAVSGCVTESDHRVCYRDDCTLAISTFFSLNFICIRWCSSCFTFLGFYVLHLMFGILQWLRCCKEWSYNKIVLLLRLVLLLLIIYSLLFDWLDIAESITIRWRPPRPLFTSVLPVIGLALVQVSRLVLHLLLLLLRLPVFLPKLLLIATTFAPSLRLSHASIAVLHAHFRVLYLITNTHLRCI